MGDDDENAFIETYGLAIGMLAAVMIDALVAFFDMNGRKGGKVPSWSEIEGQSPGAPEDSGPPPDEQPR